MTLTLPSQLLKHFPQLLLFKHLHAFLLWVSLIGGLNDRALQLRLIAHHHCSRGDPAAVCVRWCKERGLVFILALFNMQIKDCA